MNDPLFAGHPAQSFDKDERYTPAWVFDGLGLTFDLDPASPGEGCGDCVPAVRKLTKADDGLAAEWHGRVWLNPPFSQLSQWSQKFIARGDGVFLGPIANGKWCHELMSAASIVWMLPRLRLHPPDTQRQTVVHATVLRRNR